MMVEDQLEQFCHDWFNTIGYDKHSNDKEPVLNEY